MSNSLLCPWCHEDFDLMKVISFTLECGDEDYIDDAVDCPHCGEAVFVNYQVNCEAYVQPPSRCEHCEGYSETYCGEFMCEQYGCGEKYEVVDE